MTRLASIIGLLSLLAITGCGGPIVGGQSLIRASGGSWKPPAAKQRVYDLMASSSVPSSVLVVEPTGIIQAGAAANLAGNKVYGAMQVSSSLTTRLIDVARVETALRQQEQTEDFREGLKRALHGVGPTTLDETRPLLLDKSGRIWRVDALRGTTTERLKSDKVLSKVLQNYAVDLDVKDCQGKPYTKQQISTSDMVTFVTQTLPYLGVGADDETPPAAADPDDSRAEVFNRISRYLAVYGRGKFVDRQGKKLDKPEIKEKKVGNEVLLAAISVIIEAISDSSVRLPVFYELDNGGKKKWLTAAGGDAQPTASVLDESLAKDIANSGSNIGKAEVRLMHYTAQGGGLAGNALAGYLVRIIGKLDVGQFALAGISIGDNELLVKSIDTVAETASRRLAEANIYLYLSAHAKNERPGWVNLLLATIDGAYEKTESVP